MRYYFVAALAIVALVSLLFLLFPQSLQPGNTGPRFVYLTLIAAVMAGGYLASHRFQWKQGVQYLFTWIGVFVLLILGYSFRHDFERLGSRLKGELLPQAASVNGSGEIIIRLSNDRHYRLDAEINGVAVRFLVDTGASDLILTKEDATRVGLTPEKLHYDRIYQTANGQTEGASVVLGSVKIGPLVLEDIPASVNRGDSNASLLGMRFLENFRAFRIEDDTLVLTP
jgi:aspartyl protease family protein